MENYLGYKNVLNLNNELDFIVVLFFCINLDNQFYYFIGIYNVIFKEVRLLK